MKGTVLLSVLVALVVASGAVSTASAAQLVTTIYPDSDFSEFDIRHQRTISVYYPEGGQIADLLRGESWTITASAPPGSAGSIAVADAINRNIVNDGSQAQVSDLHIEYTATMTGNPLSASIDYKIEIEGDVGQYTIRASDGRNPALIDMGWRGLSVHDAVMVGGIDINDPFAAIESQNADLASAIAGSEAEDLLHTSLIDADFVRDQPLANWHFLFDPTGISSDAALYGIADEISGFVVSSYTMGESSIREGIQVEREFDATFDADREYTVRTYQSADSANLHVIGFAQLDSLDGVEIFGVTPTPPEGYGQTPTGDFPVAIIYGMAGMAAVGGGAFFVFSSRQLKKEEGQGQSGIDPSRLVGYQTSSSAGGYQTNRVEAHLADASDHQQTRSVYEDAPGTQVSPSTTSPPPPPQVTAADPATAQEAACGCAASSEMGNECDCEMQSSCLCDADCGCGSAVCREHAQSF